MKEEMKILIWIVILSLTITSCSTDKLEVVTSTAPPISPTTSTVKSQFITETFTFSSNGKDIKGIIYLPSSHKTNDSLPTIYLVDYQEAHFAVAKDEFDQVIKGVQKIAGVDAIVVTLNNLVRIDTSPDNFEVHYNIFKDMTSYVDDNYTKNTSRTFIGRGSEAGVVLLTLLHENKNPEAAVFDNFIATGSPGSFNSVVIQTIKNTTFPTTIQNKKLHFSYDTADTESGNHQWIELINLIKSKHYSWLKFESKSYKQDFVTAYPFAYADGLRFIFKSDDGK